NQNLSEDNLTLSKNADEEVDQNTQITYKQQDESNKQIQPSDNQQKKESYTAAKEQPKLPNQSTSNQYNPGNNQQWDNEVKKNHIQQRKNKQSYQINQRPIRINQEIINNGIMKWIKMIVLLQSNSTKRNN